MVDHHLPGPQSFAQSAADTPPFETTTHLFILHRYCDGTGGGAGGGGGVQGLNGLAVVMFLPTHALEPLPQLRLCEHRHCRRRTFFADATATSKTGPNQARHNQTK